jgi:hypothetical protein
VIAPVVRLAPLAAWAVLAGAPCGWAQERVAAPAAAVPGDEEAAAAPTRAERWRALRERKREALEPRRAGFLEQTLLASEKAERPSLFAWNRGGFYPRIENIARGSWSATGVRFWKPRLGGTPLDVHASAFYSIRRYEFYDLEVGRIPHRGRQLPPRATRGDDVHEKGDARIGRQAGGFAFAAAVYEHDPRTAFYGLGNDTSAEDRTTFLFQQATYDAVAGYRFGRRLVFDARAGMRQVFIGPGGDESVPTTQEAFNDASAPGLRRQPDFFHSAVAALIDGRDEPGNPKRGAMLAVGWDLFDDLGSSSYQFQRLAADARAFVTLGSPQRVLALRARVSGDRAAAGSVVPFYYQQTLGGGQDLRGYPSFRFRGDKLVLGQAEYRWEAWPALELALFVDAGRVFVAGEDLSLRDLVHDWGFGLRLKTFEATVLRLDAAWGSEGARLSVVLRSVF